MIIHCKSSLVAVIQVTAQTQQVHVYTRLLQIWVVGMVCMVQTETSVLNRMHPPR